MLKILQARLKQYVKFQMFKLVLEKAEEPEIKLPTSAGSLKKQESSRKTSIYALLTMPMSLCGSQKTVENSEKVFMKSYAENVLVLIKMKLM